MPDGGLSAHDALAYALSPAHIYPFIHDGSSPYIGTDIDIDDCTVGRLYVYNKNTEVLTAIGSDTVISYATTKEALFFLTNEQKIYRTDFTGTNMTLLYQAEQGGIDKVRTFGHILYFIENGQNVIAIDTLTQNARTVLTLPGLSSVLLFDFDKLVYYDAEDNPFYFNFVTGVTTVLADFYEVNSLVNFYTAAEDEGIAPAYFIAPTWSYNDVDFPLPEYPAELGTNWTLPDDVQSIFDTTYGSATECEGFARYAHDRFFHLYEEEGNPDWHTDVYQPGDYFGATPDQIKQGVSAPERALNTPDDVQKFFSLLSKGAYVRYVSRSDDTPYNGRHSIVFAGLDGTTGIFAYEANQDGDNGVSYQSYSFAVLNCNYGHILYYVNHSFSDQYVVDGMYHKLCCDNCAAYLRQTHDTKIGTITTTQHYRLCSQCDWSVSEAHSYRNDICQVCGHIKGSAVINSPQNPMCLQ